MNGKMTAKKWEKTAADKKADASWRAWQEGSKRIWLPTARESPAYNKRNGKK